jgi:hypothetical protein
VTETCRDCGSKGCGRKNRLRERDPICTAYIAGDYQSIDEVTTAPIETVYITEEDVFEVPSTTTLTSTSTITAATPIKYIHGESVEDLSDE